MYPWSNRRYVGYADFFFYKCSTYASTKRFLNQRVLLFPSRNAATVHWSLSPAILWQQRAPTLHDEAELSEGGVGFTVTIEQTPVHWSDSLCLCSHTVTYLWARHQPFTLSSSFLMCDQTIHQTTQRAHILGVHNSVFYVFSSPEEAVNRYLGLKKIKNKRPCLLCAASPHRTRKAGNEKWIIEDALWRWQTS